MTAAEMYHLLPGKEIMKSIKNWSSPTELNAVAVIVVSSWNDRLGESEESALRKQTSDGIHIGFKPKGKHR